MRRTVSGLGVLAISLWGAGAPAQEVDGMVAHSLDQIERYYQLYGASRLVRAQVLFAEYGSYDGPLDGRWGAGTSAAFRNVIETRIAIGGYEWGGVHGPEDVPAALDWVGAVILANGGYGDMPD